MEQNPEPDPHLDDQLYFNKDANVIQREKDSILNKMCWNNCVSLEIKKN